jgi:hypothetical protein
MSETSHHPTDRSQLNLRSLQALAVAVGCNVFKMQQHPIMSPAAVTVAQARVQKLCSNVSYNLVVNVSLLGADGLPITRAANNVCLLPLAVAGALGSLLCWLIVLHYTSQRLLLLSAAMYHPASNYLSTCSSTCTRNHPLRGTAGALRTAYR